MSNSRSTEILKEISPQDIRREAVFFEARFRFGFVRLDPLPLLPLKIVKPDPSVLEKF